jgi:N-acetylmuramoyl-L-alanine amidase
LSLALRDLPSPSQDARPDATPIDLLVLHDTGARPTAAAIRRLRDPDEKASAHYLVDEDGEVLRLVPEDRRAWHAGPAWWRGLTAIDDRSIAIAVANPGRQPFGALQTASVCDLCLSILSRHPIPPRNIVGHADIAPDRAQGPGESFDWQGLAENGVGLFPRGVPDLGTGGPVRDAAALRDVRRALAAIGYRVVPEGPLDPALSAVLRAFQRHWRGEAVTGQADAGTLARLLAVARAVG